MHTKGIINSLILLILLLASACGGLAFSPEAAATHSLLQRSSTGLTIDQETVKIHQTVEINDSQSFVLLTFDGARPELGPVSCTYAYEVIKNRFGWSSANGSGACRQNQPGLPVEDLEIFTGSFGGRAPDDPGYTQVFGPVYHPDIVKVRLTWDDNQVTVLEPVQSTYFAIHPGKTYLRVVEGLNDQEEIIYSHFRGSPPGKTP